MCCDNQTRRDRDLWSDVTCLILRLPPFCNLGQKVSEMPDLDMSVPVTSFVYFNDLPKELRLLIWKQILLGVNQMVFNVDNSRAREDKKV